MGPYCPSRKFLFYLIDLDCGIKGCASIWYKGFLSIRWLYLFVRQGLAGLILAVEREVVY